MMPTSPRSFPDDYSSHGWDNNNRSHQSHRPRHQYQRRESEWTPPEGSESSVSTRHHLEAGHIEHDQRRDQNWHLPESRYDNHQGWGNKNKFYKFVHEHGRWSSSPTFTPPTFDYPPYHSNNSPIPTATLSPIRTRRLCGDIYHQQPKRYRQQSDDTRITKTKTTKLTATRRKIVGRNRKRRIERAPSRDAFANGQLDLPSLFSPSSSNTRSNKIYLRINRVVSKEKNTKSNVASKEMSEKKKHEDRTPSLESIPIAQGKHLRTYGNPAADSTIGSSPDKVEDPLRSHKTMSISTYTPLQTMHHPMDRQAIEENSKFDNVMIDCNLNAEEEDDGTSSGSSALLDEILSRHSESFPDFDDDINGHVLQQQGLPDVFIMTQNLLQIQSGPISWSSIAEEEPPDPFVWYLSEVLTEAVQLYIQNNIAKEYWVKHLRFWKDLLDPESLWWNSDRGVVYKDIASRFYTNFHKQWGNCDMDSMFEWHYESDQIVFVRACILFASSSSYNCEKSNITIK